jgi:signal peptidase I
MGDTTHVPFYSGRSMSGTFLPSDWLIFETIPFNLIRLGDVLIFHDKVEKRIVHRAIQIIKEGVVTQGDNNSKPDIELLEAECLLGKVTHYERNGKIHKVLNGKLGMMRARVLHGRLYAIKAAKYFLRKPYRTLKKTGIVAKLWRPSIEIIHFETLDGPLVKYIHKGKTMASCWTASKRWWFRRPYDFVIEPKLKSGKRS